MFIPRDVYDALTAELKHEKKMHFIYRHELHRFVADIINLYYQNMSESGRATSFNNLADHAFSLFATYFKEPEK